MHISPWHSGQLSSKQALRQLGRWGLQSRGAPSL